MIEKINRVLSFLVTLIAGTAFTFMTAVAFIDAVGRQMRRPLLGSHEYVELALMIFFFTALAFVVRDDGHIRVGLLTDLYKPRLAKIERTFTAIVETLALCGLSWMIFDQASRLDRFGTVSTFFRIPMAPWIYAASALSLIAIWFAIQNLINIIRDLRKRPDPGADDSPRPHAIPDEEN